MPPKAPAIGSLRTERGLAELNELLSSRSYVGGTYNATAEDMTLFAQVHSRPDPQQYPHLLRWYNHISGLRARYAPYHLWPGQAPPASQASQASKASKPSQAGEGAAAQESKKGPRAPGKEKQVLPFDCKVEPVENRRQVCGDDSVKRGTGGTCFPGAEKGSHGRYYITTAINYCNGWPHIGHAYEALTSDVFARYHRLLGQDVFFMTGADEHGQKIAQAAESEGLQPQEICDRYCLGFRALNQRLNVSNDFYVRTTAERHKAVARSVWDTCKKKGDIYLDRYEGWYMVREERFITDQEAQEFNFKDPTSGAPLKKMSEPSFFFRLSKYQKAVISLIEEKPEFIQPAQYRGEILERLKSIELRDLSISRGTFDWGVSCPEDLVDGKRHVMYVWFDALINYLSGIDGIDPKKPLSRFWPANMHIVGKDIHWFHTVIWPAMLISAGIRLPQSVVVHGFIAGADGRKMSKSLGNVVDPHDMLDKFPCDTLRWYFCREAAFGDDVRFSEDSLRLMHNAELCDNLGNLVNRAVNLSGGSVPRCDVEVSLPFDLKELKASVSEAFEAYRLSDAADLTVRAAGATNKWIADLEPWKMKAAEQQALRSACLRKLLEAVYALAHFFAPFIPIAAEAIFAKVGQPPRPIPELRDDFTNLEDGKEVKATSLLFSQLEVKKVDVDTATEKKAEAKAKAESKKK
ncbi:metG [Symbiodinium natans]|uniref:methionine--tRNA ligase n=1 Tax=Symbiodinium natans TaxID=878477 RepID=A0A812U0Z8_9DINO|nr:metG [Symbiodinium natans]